MSNLTPFQMGQQVGENFAPAIRQGTDYSAIDKIMAQAKEGTDETDFDGLMAQIIQRVSPENQKAALGILQDKKAKQIEGRHQKEYETLANELEQSNPNNMLYKNLSNILRSDIPASQKKDLAKSISDAIPFRHQQQKRLQKDQVLKIYNTKIKEIDEEIKNSYGDERNELIKNKRQLQQDRDIAINLESLFEPKEVTEKIKFDQNNPEHMEIYKSVKEEFKGDKDKINAKLAEQFTK